jgi:SAM-dependent methyltransferase
MSPWWFTDKIMRKYLARSVPYLTGRLLDAGCGSQLYKNMFQCDAYTGMEISSRFKPDIVGDVRHIDMVGDGSFDSVLCNQVLEHVDDVERAIAEMHRVLRPGGCLCVTVPFIGRLHGMPHDYWRFSISGLRYLLEKHHFEVELIDPMGGFLTTQCFLWQFFIYERCERYAATRFLCRMVMLVLNPLCLLIHQLDRDTTTPFNYVAVARKARQGAGPPSQ